jgi:hypothetical protein
MKKLTITILALISIVACNPDKFNPDDFNIIEPGSYFPVYPNSYWKYEVFRNQVTYDPQLDTVYVTPYDTFYRTYSTEPEYQLHTYKPEPRYVDGELRYPSSEPVFVPIYEGIPIYKYRKPVTRGYMYGSNEYQELWPFMSERVGDTIHPPPSKYVVPGPYYETVLKTVDANNDSILVIREFYLPGAAVFNQYKTYKKNVGLVSIVKYNAETISTRETWRLIEYQINGQ